MTRSATLTAAAAVLAFGAMAAAPVGVSVFAPPPPVAERTTVGCAGANNPAVPAWRRRADGADCGAPTAVLKFGKGNPGWEKYGTASPACARPVPARTFNQDGCAGADPLVLVGLRHPRTGPRSGPRQPLG